MRSDAYVMKFWKTMVQRGLIKAWKENLPLKRIFEERMSLQRQIFPSVDLLVLQNAQMLSKVSLFWSWVAGKKFFEKLVNPPNLSIEDGSCSLPPFSRPIPKRPSRSNDRGWRAGCHLETPNFSSPGPVACSDRDIDMSSTPCSRIPPSTHNTVPCISSISACNNPCVIYIMGNNLDARPIALFKDCSEIIKIFL